jgi:hypothetical protein
MVKLITVRSAPQWGYWPRYCNMLLGLWLFFSAFVWAHTPGNRINTCLVGLFVGTAATLAAGASVIRRLTAALACWLMFTTLVVYPARPATFWNNLIMAALILGVSLIPSPDELRIY